MEAAFNTLRIVKLASAEAPKPVTKEAQDVKKNSVKSQGGDICSLGLGVQEFAQTNVPIHYVETKRGDASPMSTF